MKTTITTSLPVKNNHLNAEEFLRWVEIVPSNAVITFQIQKGYSDPRESVPTAVTAINAAWVQEF